MSFASISRGLGRFAINNAHTVPRLFPNVMGSTTFGVRTFASKKVWSKQIVLVSIELKCFGSNCVSLVFAEKEPAQACEGIPRKIKELLSSCYPTSSQILAVLIPRPAKEET